MTGRRDPRILLLDVDKAAAKIEGYIEGMDFSTYIESAGVQDQLERNFITIGEALNQLSMVSPDLSGRIPNVKDIIGFRHKLVHGYDHIDAEVVWSAAVDDLSELRRTIQSLLVELDEVASNRNPGEGEDRKESGRHGSPPTPLDTGLPGPPSPFDCQD